MDSKRAQQIIDSKKKETVYYKNTPVHIKEVDNKSDTVKVENLQTGKDFVVNVKTLNEDFGLKQ
ncbi:small, acid-soluble spore protein H [Clostridium tepidiprofundi DSM 19306]|uniref:Small, acid-soluble spore protein H n=1 Tax=Clostridium tepidiprofundi DSM 19306 TaxID=1121338 RepID=A0A151B7Z0_9CLOT|nr:H-type small acid-soluble spore protein [Clostridium tepidiprofundi]KYH36004.1 small, acid-soluble spore protein H [Clostridium tepidiprofundi DSM 19306]